MSITSGFPDSTYNTTLPTLLQRTMKNILVPVSQALQLTLVGMFKPRQYQTPRWKGNTFFRYCTTLFQFIILLNILHGFHDPTHGINNIILFKVNSNGIKKSIREIHFCAFSLNSSLPSCSSVKVSVSAVATVSLPTVAVNGTFPLSSFLVPWYLTSLIFRIDAFLFPSFENATEYVAVDYSISISSYWATASNFCLTRPFLSYKSIKLFSFFVKSEVGVSQCVWLLGTMNETRLLSLRILWVSAHSSIIVTKIRHFAWKFLLTGQVKDVFLRRLLACWSLYR